ncbi:MAG: 3-phosphoshikimate 1-carboxyvinyltransferase [Actinomycetota bacterium]|nr:3-phosphoshikimate 1-carboxyvinyltransferase [Actinomycetota bacterium]
MRFSGPRRPFRARVVVPGDKSLSHRALFLAAMAEGESQIRGLGPGADVRSTAAALRRFGVEVDAESVRSPGIGSWAPPDGPLDAGNSGTTMRLLAGAVAGRPFTTTITGDDSLMSRPMQRLVGPLQALGAVLSVSEQGTAPLVVTGGDLHGARVELPLPSAQVRTAVALAALQADGPTTISSPPGYRDHTERWLHHLGIGELDAAGRFVVRPGPVPALDVAIPGDPSSAAFLWVAAAICPGASVEATNVSLNPGRIGILDALSAMGAEVAITVTGDILGDPVGDVRVAAGNLRGIELHGVDVARILDELPVLAVAAAHAEGRTVISDAAELRAKESDRIAATVAMVEALGGTAEETLDGFVVEPVPLTGGLVDCRRDHRIAMAAAISAGRGATVAVEGFDSVDISWPGFDLALEAMWSSR